MDDRSKLEQVQAELFQSFNDTLARLGIDGRVTHLFIADPDSSYDADLQQRASRAIDSVFTEPQPGLEVAGCWWCKDEFGTWRRCCLA